MSKTAGGYTRRVAAAAGWRSMARCCFNEPPTGQARTICGLHWLYYPLMLVVVAGPGVAAGIDVAHGYPGGGVTIVAVLWPSISIAFSFASSATILYLYLAQAVLYLVWCMVYANERGIGGWGTATGANIVGIAMALVQTGLPLVLLAGVVSYDQELSMKHARRTVRKAYGVARSAGKYHAALSKMIKRSMPRFALRSLAVGARAFEAESCFVAIRVHITDGKSLVGALENPLALGRAFSVIDFVTSRHSGVEKIQTDGFSWLGAADIETPYETHEERIRRKAEKQRRKAAKQAKEAQSRGAASTTDSSHVGGTTPRVSYQTDGGEEEAAGGESRGSSRNDAGSSEGRSTASKGKSRKRVSTKAESAAKAVIVAIDAAVTMQQVFAVLSSSGYFGDGTTVRLSVGISGGAEVVIGFIGSDVSAHSWTAVGDSVSEARTLAGLMPAKIRVASSALKHLWDLDRWLPKKDLDMQSMSLSSRGSSSGGD